MTDPAPTGGGSAPAASRYSIYRNWLSLAGLVVACASLFAFVLLFIIDAMTGGANPYLGILTYLASPAFLILGLGLMFAGWVRYKRRLRRGLDGKEAFFVDLDFSRPRDRRNLVLFVGGTVGFLFLTALGSYQTYHYTESVQFCGEVCHSVMNPEYTAYLRGSHARVACVECHIGSGATWYVKSKLSGLYQVYSTAFNKYSRPIDTPVHNLRPAQDTCEQCHWPQKFIGSLDRTFERFLADDDNTPYAVRLSIKVGGGDPALGRVGGIHWHMNVANKVEFSSTDSDHLVIPQVRLTMPDGTVREYRSPDYKPLPDAAPMHVMDCVDCHTRPSHAFLSANDAVDDAIATGRIDRSLRAVKKNAVALLTRTYSSEAEALQAIGEGMASAYPGEDARVPRAVAALRSIYSANFFPEMRVSWRGYPNQIGHKDWPGCFRCHDGKHQTADGQHTITSDCNACHTILAQGKGEELQRLAPHGLAFAHPGPDAEGTLCSECHTGGSMDE